MRKDLGDTAVRVMVEGAHQFMIELINHVPVYTGMSRESIKPLAEWLSSRPFSMSFSWGMVEVPIDDEIKRADRWARARRATGRSYSVPQTGFVDFHANQYGLNTIWFEWDSLVPHWVLLDDSGHPNVLSAPWHAGEQARAVFFSYVDLMFHRRVRGLKSYITLGAD